MNELKYNVNGEALNKYEVEKFNTFYADLNKNPKKIKVIYRGENYDNLKEKLDLTNDNDYNKINKYIFLIGEKGRVYRNKHKNKLKHKSKIYSIDNIQDNLFNKIFDKFNLILKNKSLNQVVEIFKSNNYEFSEYFKDKRNNKLDFIIKINSFSKTNERLKVRDYYLSLLHKIGNIGFFHNSFFVSTSSDFNTAVSFAENSNNSKKIIFISWVEYPINIIGINFNYLNLFKNKITQVALPSYNKSFFPSQNEITIKGGLLPHFILGYIRLEDKIFEINPNFFYTTKNFEKVIKNGFDINQSNFAEALNETDYSGFFMLNDNNLYSDINT